MTIARRPRSATGFAGYQFGLDDEQVEPVQQPLEDLPSTDAAGKATFPVAIDKLPSTTHPLQAQIAVRMAEPGGRAVEHTLTLPVTPSGNMIGVKPLFSGRSLADGANATFDVVVVAPDGTAVAQKGLHYQLSRIETHYQFYKRDGQWNFEPVKTTTRVADGTLDTRGRQAGRILRCRCISAATGSKWRRPMPNGPVTSVDFDAGWYVDASADTPDMLEVALDKPEYQPGDTMTVAVTARSAGRLTLNVIGDKLLASQSADIKQGRSAGQSAGRPRLGHRRLSGRDAAPAARCARAAHARPRHRRAVVLHRPRGEDADASICRRRRCCGRTRHLQLPVKVNGLAPGEQAQSRRRRGRCRHSQSDQLQAAVAQRLLSRPARAFGRHPRPLRPVDRRHAGHARPDPHRR